MTEKTWANYLFHAVCYYIVWFTCLVLAARNQAWLAIGISMLIIGLQIFWQYRIAKNTRHLWSLVLIILIVATIVDASMVWLDLIRYRSNPLAPWLGPIWIMVLWLEFAVICQAVLENFWNRPITLAMLCLAGLPLAYVAGEKIGAATLTHGWYSTLLLGAIWAIILPVVLYLHHKKAQAL